MAARLSPTQLSLSLATLSLFAGFAAWTLTAGRLADLGGLGGALQKLGGTYGAVLLIRVDMLEGLPSFFFWAVYSGVPTLCFLSVHLVHKQRSKLAVGTMLFLVCGICLLDLLTFLKGPIFVLLLSLVIVLVELRVISAKVALAFPAMLFGVLTLWLASNSYRTDGSYSSLDALLHTLMRMAHAYPYYHTMYPQLMSLKNEVPLNDLGPLMYASKTLVTPFITGSSHMLGWSTGGWSGAVLSQFLVAALIVFVATLRRYRDDPLFFAVYIEGLVSMYFCSQTSVIECIAGGQGLVWGIVAVGSVVVLALLGIPSLRTPSFSSNQEVPSQAAP
jgi:hypothetical protein